MSTFNKTSLLSIAIAATLGLGCLSDSAEGIAVSEPAATTVKFDFFHKPLPDIPMPNDLATRVDKSSATGLRLNASKTAGSLWEQRTREFIDRLDGWGTMQPITIPFTGPLDIASITAGHRDTDYNFANDVVYLINVDPDSKEYGKVQHIDLGEGNFPISVKDKDHYWKNDPRLETTTLLFEEYDEDLNGNGVLDPGEDTDADGLLDKPNYYPGATPDWDDTAARSDATMSFYEKQTNTLIIRPLMPLRERTTYAVIVTKRLLDESGKSVGSPFDYVNHTSQTQALKHLEPVLPEYFSMKDIAFAFTYTTQTVQSAMVAVRDGLYGHGVQSAIGDVSTDITLLPARNPEHFTGLKRPHLLNGEEWSDLLPLIGPALLGGEENSKSAEAVERAAKYIDYFVIGSFDSPQLRKRFDKDGNFLDLNLQSWPEDLDRVPAEVTLEKVYFTLMVPRKEVSVRGQGKPAPLLLVTHGHGSSRSEMLLTSVWFAEHGFAVMSIDAPGHGIELKPSDKELLERILAPQGLDPFVESLVTGRTVDLNGDGIGDSGDDFWTSYLFHTRDNIRQYALDLMQLTKIVKSFNGTRMGPDTNGDGSPNLAGDFDGDGLLDIGADSQLSMFGGSMGGIAAMFMAGVEPELDGIIPVVGGGVMSDIGFRSNNGSVPGSFFLQGVMGPLWTGTLDENGSMKIEHITEELAKAAYLEVGTVTGLEVGDLMMVTNTRTGAVGCGYILEGGGVRAGSEVNYFDPVSIAFYRGVQVAEECVMDKESTPVAVLDKFGSDFSFKGRGYRAGDALIALGEGVGRLRGHPNLRRMRGIGQLILDPGDPINFARHALMEPLEFPGTGQKTGAHVLSVSTLGDMNVPTATGINWARAAGIVDFIEVDSRYGKSINQVLIDTHTVEGNAPQKRFIDENGVGVHLDVEHFSKGMDDKWGVSYPRFDTPLHIGFDSDDPLGGRSTVIFPLTLSTGEHGFTFPGGFHDDAIDKCELECFENNTPCDCDNIEIYDIGYFLINFAARWVTSGYKTLDADNCNSRNDCPDVLKDAPPRREASELL
ncbi:MAG: hypothetical protein JKY56_21260 [Kofleriaceae bacterium]|nr:hypothetical protein [Kofleriaceae bacterium]